MTVTGLSTFTEKWCHPEYPPDSVEASELAKVEQKLGRKLPDSYKTAVLQTGLPRPGASLLDCICDNNVDLPDLSDFHSPEDMVSLTNGWREIGMPDTLIAIASDCSGNLFAFNESPEINADEIWFFDHDFGSTRKIAESFEDWLNSYNKLKP